MVESKKVESNTLPPTLSEPKDFSKGEIYKYQKKSHPEVQKWQSELERKKLESKASLDTPHKMQKLTKETNPPTQKVPIPPPSYTKT